MIWQGVLEGNQEETFRRADMSETLDLAEIGISKSGFTLSGIDFQAVGLP